MSIYSLSKEMTEWLKVRIKQDAKGVMELDSRAPCLPGEN